MYEEQLTSIHRVLPEIAELMKKELNDQRRNLKMIASENYCSAAVRAAMGSIFTDKYSEGYPYHRYYEGCNNVDEMESLAVSLACELFGADYANVQPHCGSDANMMAYWAVLDAKVLTPRFEELKDSINKGLSGRRVRSYTDLTDEEWNYLKESCRNQKMLSMDYYSGSHLTHGYRNNISAHLFDCHYYSVGADGLLDYDAIERKAMEIRPLILLAGYSSYPRAIDFSRFRDIADRCGAVLMVDMAHFAGLVAGKVYTDRLDPVKWADIVTTTTHKTLRGPRGGMVLCREWLKESLNKGCPMVMGGALQNMVAAKAICFKEAMSEDFRKYASQIVSNASALARGLNREGLKVLTGGTDNHMVIVDVSPMGITGRQAESALKKFGITCNRNVIPNDPNGPWYTSGIRLGVPALTTLGMKEEEMEEISHYISDVLRSSIPCSKSNGAPSKSRVCFREGDSIVDYSGDCLAEVSIGVRNIMSRFVPYPDLS